MDEKSNVFDLLDRLEFSVSAARHFAERYKKSSSTGRFFESDALRQTILSLLSEVASLLGDIWGVYERPIDRQMSVFDLDVKTECRDELDFRKR